MALPGTIPLATRQGREIPNSQVPDIPPAKASQVTEKFRNTYFGAVLRRPPSGQYNCFGLTFANRRTGIGGLATDSIIDSILRDDGYRRISVAEAESGDLVIYFKGKEFWHAGLIVEVESNELMPGRRLATVISKWGEAGEYTHPTTVGPYANEEVTYWTDRP